MNSPTSYRLRLRLRNLRVPLEDPLLDRGSGIRFSSLVSPQGDSLRAQVRSFPARGQYMRLQRGRRYASAETNRILFDGTLEAGEEVLLLFFALPEDLPRSKAERVRLRSVLLGDPRQSSRRIRIIGGGFEPEGESEQDPWQAEIEVGFRPLTRTRSRRAPGEHVERERFLEEWRRARWGPPPDPALARRERARALRLRRRLEKPPASRSEIDLPEPSRTRARLEPPEVLRHPARETGTWQSIGPTYPTGVVCDLAVHPDEPRTLFAATQHGGVWRTLDGGATWTPMTDHLSNLDAYAVAIAGKKRADARHRTVYLGTRLSDLGDIGLYASQDNGLSWEPCSPLPSTRVLALATGHDNARLIYVAGSAGLHKSLDGGYSWESHDPVVDGVTVVDGVKKTKDAPASVFKGRIWHVKLDPTNDDVVWIATAGGIFVSRDAGMSWRSTAGSIPELSGTTRIVLDIGQDSRSGAHGTEFVVAKAGTTVVSTADGGKNWEALPTTPDSAQPQWSTGLAIDPDDERRIVAGNFAVVETQGETAVPSWTLVNGGAYYPAWDGPSKTDEYHPDVQVIRFDPHQRGSYYVATDGGISRVSGSRVQRISDGIVAGELFYIDVSQTDTIRTGCSTYHVGICRRERGSSVWTWVEIAEGGLYRIDPRDSSLHFCAPWGRGLRRSTSNGDQFSWAEIPLRTSPIDDGPTATVQPEELEFRPSGPHVIWVGTRWDRLFFSTDRGQTFSPLGEEGFKSSGEDLLLDETGAYDAGALSIAFAPSAPDIMFVGTRGGRIWKTTTGAMTASGWNRLEVPRPDLQAVSAIAVHPTVPNTVYVGYAVTGEVNLYRSTSGGLGTDPWQPAVGESEESLPQFPVVDIVIAPENPLRLFVALKWGVYWTEDGGSRWMRFDQGLPTVALSEMRLHRETHALYLATAGRGGYCRPIGGVE